MTILSFCQSDPPMSESFWQKDRMVTHILFDICQFKHLSPVANFGYQSIILIQVFAKMKQKLSKSCTVSNWLARSKLQAEPRETISDLNSVPRQQPKPKGVAV